MAISIADSSCSSPRSSLGFLLDPEKFEPPRPKQSMWHRLGLRRWLGRDDRDFASRSPSSSDDTSPASRGRSKGTASPPKSSHDNLTRRLSRRVGVGLPRSTTFKRQHSERRDRLSPVNTEPRRAASADRRESSLQRTKSPQSVVDPRLSAPEINWPRDDPDPDPPTAPKDDDPPEANEDHPQHIDVRSEWDHHPEMTDTPEGYPADIFDMELERRWILNLSMHFRDRSEREKFFVTYAEAANRWRRVSISCDYRDAEPDSLEQDLRELRYQRDKCARIYESIRESLPAIQFYDTVTNLKLETRDGRLHVHVTEDVNEIIPYPPISSIGHLPDARLVPERRLHFEAHLSGFVYNVRLGDRSFIKKEIPGPDTVDEFLYEINALHALQGTPNVIQVEGIVVDDRQEVVKGLLISFAEKGALVDILYEYRGTLSWERRERWARQIVHGLCEIHEAGYVQGDFTLSNIVVDGNDDAKIIDINRRGCPVGWEPPEIAAKIESNQRISMYIGVKTDLYQLGMTLWALAMEEDEPERQRRPFLLSENMPVPDYYRRLVSICLSPVPRNRLSAKELLNLFPPETPTFDQLPRMHPHIGVGLHNGALPLYDSRATFMYPRGRSVGGFGHNQAQTQHQHPHGSLDSTSSPISDGAAFEREEHERQMELYNMDTQPNGVHKQDSIMFDERMSIDHLAPMTLDDTQEFQHSAPMHYEESEIDLEAGVSHRYRIPPTRSTIESPSDDQAMPDELVGVGSWKPPSQHDLAPYNPTELSTSPQPPTDIYPVSPVAEAQTTEAQFPNTPPLLQRPTINPAAESFKQVHETSENLPTVTAALEGEHSSSQSTYLSDSGLPINPALKAIKETFSQYLPLENQSAPECPQEIHRQLSPYLSDSKLPINPAARAPGTVPPALEVYKQSTPAEALVNLSQKVIEVESHSLGDSRLPINPAIQSADQIVSSHELTTRPEQAFQDETTDTFLSDSHLPINPAATSVENWTSPLDTKPALNGKETLCSRYIISDPNQDSFLSNSHLPINPAFPSPEGKITNIAPPSISAVGIQSGAVPQQVAHDRTTYLSDSHLPINPSYTDKAMPIVCPTMTPSSPHHTKQTVQ
ncbi:hypothetical protein BJY04DRAFT_225791 [Aspergillus karnatakaensis]|uniref:protein kinase family protein n=1 Tax=Aspergillus karnatakaensis TaxID=1810916 RepID=UPI003CCD308D